MGKIWLLLITKSVQTAQTAKYFFNLGLSIVQMLKVRSFLTKWAFLFITCYRSEHVLLVGSPIVHMLMVRTYLTR